MAANVTHTNPDDCSGYCHASLIMWSFLLPPLIAMGLIGNLLIILVFTTSQKLRKRKPVLCVTMATLACADLMVFLFPITRHWLRQAKLYVEFDVQTLGTGVCKVHEFCVYFSLMFSTWMVVLVSAERFTIICFPMRRSRLLSTRRVVGIIVAMVIACCLINGHFLWTRVFVWSNKHNRMSCQNAGEGLALLVVDKIYPSIDIVVSVAVPFVLLFLFSALIGHRLYKRSRQLKAMAAGQSSRSRLLTPTTRMLLPIPLVFVPLALPVKVWLLVFQRGIPRWVPNDTPEYYVIRFRWSCLLMLQFCNFASNFFIYSLMSADFRSDLRQLLCGWRKQRAPVGVTAFDGPQQQRSNSNRDDTSSVFHLNYRMSRHS